MLQKIIAALLVSLLLLTFTSCSNTSQPVNKTAEPVNLSLLLGNNALFPAMNNSNIETLYNETYNAYMAGSTQEGGSVSVVILDGNPYVPIQHSIDVITTNITRSKRQSKAENAATNLLRQSVTSLALTEEIDLLKGLSRSAQLVKAGNANRKKVMIYANGLQTTGILNMLKTDFLNGNLNMLCRELLNKNIIEFEGVEFLWVGIGCVSSNSNQKIPDSVIQKIKVFWQTIIEAAGGTIEFKNDYIAGESSPNLPKVSPVPFAPDEISSSVVYKKFDENTIKFLGDQAVFSNEKAANKALKPVALFLSQNPNQKIVIVGSTASIGSLESCLSLSSRRAEQCKKALVSFGVNSQQITTLGVGRNPNCFLRIHDTDEKGNLVESLAAQNRAVFILDANSKEAETLIQENRVA